ncbi:centromere protein R isoform X3 [Ascaphus truei]|uniref:centromere protein R isoform X3 n=1 Tax=Ascaphus truei TaxID=8439 RepID=UPI003F5A24BF
MPIMAFNSTASSSCLITKHEITPRKRNQQRSNAFSPTTGTCQMSPSLVSKKNAKGLKQVRSEVDAVDSIETGRPSRGQPPTEEKAEFLELFTQVEKSLGTFLKMRQSLKNLKGPETTRDAAFPLLRRYTALEGSRELENVDGRPFGDLSAELQKTKVLMSEAKKKVY